MVLCHRSVTGVEELCLHRLDAVMWGQDSGALTWEDKESGAGWG